MRTEARSPWRLLLLSFFYSCYWFSERDVQFSECKCLTCTLIEWLTLLTNILGPFRCLLCHLISHFQGVLWALCHAPAAGTCRRAKQGRAGRHAHSWKQQLRPGRGSTVTVQGTVLIPSSFCSIEGSHWDRVPEDWTRRLGSRLQCCYQKDAEPQAMYKTQTAIEAAQL